MLLKDMIEKGGPEVQTATASQLVAGIQFGGSASVPVADWMIACEAHGLSSSSDGASKAKAFKLAEEALLERRLIVELGDRVHLLKGAGE